VVKIKVWQSEGKCLKKQVTRGGVILREICQRLASQNKLLRDFIRRFDQLFEPADFFCRFFVFSLGIEGNNLLLQVGNLKIFWPQQNRKLILVDSQTL